MRSLNNLLNIYYTSVGGNSLLLLNVPPDTRGRFCDRDVQRLHELGEAIRKGVEKPVRIAKLDAYRPEQGFEIKISSLMTKPAMHRSGRHHITRSSCTLTIL